MIDIMTNNILAPIKVEKKIPIHLYNRLHKRREHESSVEKVIREGTLAKVMPDLSKEQKVTFLEKYMNPFVPKLIFFMIVQNKIEALVQHNELSWKNFFCFITN